MAICHGKQNSGKHAVLAMWRVPLRQMCRPHVTAFLCVAHNTRKARGTDGRHLVGVDDAVCAEHGARVGGDASSRRHIVALVQAHLRPSMGHISWCQLRMAAKYCSPHRSNKATAADANQQCPHAKLRPPEPSGAWCSMTIAVFTWYWRCSWGAMTHVCRAAAPAQASAAPGP